MERFIAIPCSKTPASLIVVLNDGLSFIARKRSVCIAEEDQQPSRPAHGTLRPNDAASRVETEIGNTLQPFLDRNRHFHAREIRADAAVDAKAEGGMAIFLAINQNLVGI